MMQKSETHMAFEIYMYKERIENAWAKGS